MRLQTSWADEAVEKMKSCFVIDWHRVSEEAMASILANLIGEVQQEAFDEGQDEGFESGQNSLLDAGFIPPS